MPHRPHSEGVMLFVPGYLRTRETMQSYPPMVDSYRRRVNVDLVICPWETPSVPEMAGRIVDRYLEITRAKTVEDGANLCLPVYLGTFSMGAPAVLLAVEELERRGLDQQVAGVYLASPSPAFGEPLRLMMDDPIAQLGEQGNDWLALKVSERAGLEQREIPKIHKPTHIYLGQKEAPIMWKMAGLLLRDLSPFATFHEVPGTAHDVGGENYVKTVDQFASETYNLGVLHEPGFDLADLNWRGGDGIKFELAFTHRGGVAVRDRETQETMVSTLAGFHCYFTSVMDGEFGVYLAGGRRAILQRRIRRAAMSLLHDITDMGRRHRGKP